mmetsp:Transcript_28742/g.84769  ORF Transcript_28742/g.84769 Transcript_28742/m.84769 type:complete len:224 (-) Transcript_28742:135-806(-)
MLAARPPEPSLRVRLYALVGNRRAPGQPSTDGRRASQPHRGSGNRGREGNIEVPLESPRESVVDASPRFSVRRTPRRRRGLSGFARCSAERQGGRRVRRRGDGDGDGDGGGDGKKSNGNPGGNGDGSGSCGASNSGMDPEAAHPLPEGNAWDQNRPSNVGGGSGNGSGGEDANAMAPPPLGGGEKATREALRRQLEMYVPGEDDAAGGAPSATKKPKLHSYSV